MSTTPCKGENQAAPVNGECRYLAGSGVFPRNLLLLKLLIIIVIIILISVKWFDRV
jgi:hypothetical protein